MQRLLILAMLGLGGCSYIEDLFDQGAELGYAENTEALFDPCQQCIDRICGACLRPQCIMETKTAVCEEYRTSVHKNFDDRTTPEEKRAYCRERLNDCDNAVAELEEMARPPTREEAPAKWVGYRIDTAEKASSDPNERRRILACEVRSLIKSSEKITTRMLLTRPNRYKGQPIVFDGQVNQVMEREGVSTLLIGVGSGDQIFVADRGGSDVLNRQRVRVYGIADGTYSYESVAGFHLTVPMVFAMALGPYRTMYSVERRCR